jgi:hypothetical protein
MIEKLYNEDEGKLGTIADKINEIIDEVNKMQNHFHHARELQFGTEYPTFGKVAELSPGDGSD